MDLALGLAFAGYHLLKNRRRPRINIDEPYLLNIPPEIRLIIYEIVFEEPEESQLASKCLEPLLTCRQIYQEAHQRAFVRTNFYYRITSMHPPYWSPTILRLSASKLRCVRKITILWEGTQLEVVVLRRFFFALACGPLKLEHLAFVITNQYTLERFLFKYGPLYPHIQEFGQYVTEELPLMDNVDKIVFPSPAIDVKKTFQYLFAPDKPRIQFGTIPGFPNPQRVPKKMGSWKYTVVRESKDVKTWRLELTHPEPTIGELSTEDEERSQKSSIGTRPDS
ncbi:hypothetical protein K505DRAFT_360241 [Melanomma pulvis-pyrius CBS 109.77]|uniref:Uncharacterized protein n=1 Tax=Melanomma pulvis-pyrius CBS 109.77 TaxID=1314802 RepID=A0A6A6XHI1_9PLEO|nr:hypothetical protein K505DRAFT_360241 [Melanomma pulvis-pyrius CBS 109.77]